MRFMSIASGSSGNSYYVGTDKVSILLDAGISMKKIDSGLGELGLSLKDIDAVLITHEHIDHIKSLGSIARKYNIPIYATYGTVDGITTVKSLGTFDYNLLNPIKNTGSFVLGDMNINVHPISHDAADPVCYSFENNGHKVSVATDLGVYDEKLIDFLSESEAMVVEANHDIRMLEVGPYPYSLKKRILGEYGHLCNEAAGRLIRELLHEKVRYIALGHLSDKNNYPSLAYETVKQELSDNTYTDDVRDFGLTVASRSECGAIIEL
ncbi:MAG: MBL fold metallo-hydrolase [Eubacterium sp.]|nr:MBL fold metallo-hydrolase [Eubacterium sp.]